MALNAENYNPSLKYGAELVTDDLSDSAVTAAKVADNSLNGNKVADVGDSDTAGGVPVVYRIDTDGSGSSTKNVTVDSKIRVIDAWCVLNGAGAASDTVTVQETGNAITDAMDVSGSDTDIVRAGQIDDANHEIDAGGTLRVVHSDDSGSDAPSITVYVQAVRVA